MANLNDPKIRLIGDNEKPLIIEPNLVGCGFLLFPMEMSGILGEDHVHQALHTNKTALWNAVRLNNPAIPVHLITTNKEVNPGDAIAGLNKIGKYSGYSIALDPMQISLDGGKTLVTIYVGFNWKASEQEVIVAGPQKIIPA